MKYWDASALVPLLLEENASGPLRELLRKDPQRIAWWASPVECFAAVQRAARSGRLTAQNLPSWREQMSCFFEEVDIIVPSQSLRDRAIRLLAVHPLRSADALQLAAALTSVQERPQGRSFVCLDERLRNAALAEGFSVLP